MSWPSPATPRDDSPRGGLTYHEDLERGLDDDLDLEHDLERINRLLSIDGRPETLVVDLSSPSDEPYTINIALAAQLDAPRREQDPNKHHED